MKAKDLISKAKEFITSQKQEIQELYNGKIFNSENAHTVAASGDLENIELRFKHYIHDTNKDIRDASTNGEFGLMVHFYDEIIQTKMDDFAAYYEKLGYEVEINYSHHIVIILW